MAIPTPADSIRPRTVRDRAPAPRAWRAPLLALLVWVLGVGALPAAAAPSAPSKDNAVWLHQLADGDAPARRQALLRLAEQGTNAAVPSVIRALRDRDALARELAEQALWAIWSRSGDEEVDSMLYDGTQMLAFGQLDAALQVFNRVIEHAPDFAEGWNKRATVYYEMGLYEASLRDIDETLKRNPQHFGALSGAGLCLVELGRLSEALVYFERALAINPNMKGIVELKRAVEKRVHRPVA